MIFFIGSSLRLSRIETALARLAGIMELMMPTKQAIEEMRTTIARNTDIVESATTALKAYMLSVEDLTAQLHAASDQGNAEAIKALITRLEENNEQLEAAIPVISEAVAENIEEEEDEDKEPA